MLHLFKSAAARTATLTLMGVLALGLAIGALRLALPFADVFRSQVEGLLAETLGLDVRVGRFGLRLAGWIPRLTLEDVKLLCPESGQRQLSLRELRLDLSLAESIRRLEPHIESLTLVGAHLMVKRREDGGLVLVGLEDLEAGANPRVLTFFLAKGRFLLTDSDVLWVDERSAAPPLQLTDVRLRFDNQADRHRIGLMARFPEDPDSEIHLAADLQGAPEQPEDWSGDIYLRVRGHDLAPALSGRLPGGLRIGSEAAHLELWSRVADSALVDTIGRLSADGLTAWRETAEGTTAPLRLARLATLMRWERDGEGWGLEIADLLTQRDGTVERRLDLALKGAPAPGGGWSLRGGVGELDLADLAALADLLPGLPAAAGRLREGSPRGRLADLRFSIEQLPGKGPAWKLSARGEALSLEPVERLPGFRGLDVRIAASQERGVLTLSSEDLALSHPALFSAPLVLDRLAGALHWHRDASGRLQIEAPDLAAENGDIRTRSRLALVLPSGDARPFLDLHTHFQVEDASAVRRYIPSRRLKEKLVRWLENAFAGGRIPEGSLLFRGEPADFPFDAQQGRFQVLASAEDVALTFHREWPRLEGIIGQLRFENRGMDITASSARLLDSEIRSAGVRIPDLTAVTAIEIEGRAEGPFADGLRLLTETPLEKRLGGVGQAFQAEGRMRVDIEALSVPFTHQGRKGPLTLKGRISWPEPASLALARWEPLKLERLGGSLSFTESSVSAEAIEARLWDQPIRLGIASRSAPEGAGASTQIDVKGRMPAQVLARHFPSDLWALAEGAAELELRLDLDAADLGQAGASLRYSLGSELSGLRVELPEPVGKGQAETRPLRLEGVLIPGKALDARGRYGDLGLDLRLTRQESGRLRLARGSLNLGGDAEEARGEGVRLTGSLAALDLSAWQAWWEARGTRVAGAKEGASLRSASLTVKQLSLGDLALEEARLDAARGPRRWEVRLDAPELAGSIRIPHQPRSEPLQIYLDRLDLAGLWPERPASGEPAENGKGRSDPRRAHRLDLRIERLLWGDHLLGSATIDSRAVPGGMEFAPIRLAGEHVSIEGKAAWSLEDDSPRTRIELEGKSGDLGEFLRLLDDETPLDQAPATARLKLDWDGGPTELSAAALNGEVRLEIGKGSLLDVEPGVGRMLGILNLGALQRRLSLDFSDLFGRGYAFEQIAGSLRIRKGQATIAELFIEGPSARLEIGGKTDLVARKYEQVVTVIPRIGSGVAIVSAVAAGPLVGAAVYLADKVTGGAVDRLGSYQYQITGPWDNPNIQRKGLLEQGVGQRLFPAGEPAKAPRAADAGPATADEKPVATPAPEAGRKRDETNHFLDGH